MKFPIQPNNPILQRELLHQKRCVSPWLWRAELVGIIAIPLFLSPILLMRSLQVDDYFLGRFYSPPRYTTLQSLLPLIWGFHALAAIRAIMAGTHAMSRDFQQSTWDEIRLTGITARQLLVGKWWGALYRVRGWLVTLGILQMLIIPIFTAEVTFSNYGQAFAFFQHCNHVTISADCLERSLSYNRWGVTREGLSIIGVTTAIYLSIFEAVCCTAIGLATSVITRVSTLAAAIGMIVRFTPVLIFSIYPDYPNASGALLWRWHEYTWFALADGGTTAVMRIIAPGLNRELEAVLASTGLLSAFGIGAVSIVLVILHRNGLAWRR